jgi:hypothetical protein
MEFPFFANVGLEGVNGVSGVMFREELALGSSGLRPKWS